MNTETSPPPERLIATALATAPWHSFSTDEVINNTKTNIISGLSQAEVIERKKTFGLNQLTQKATRSALLILTDQFKSSVVILLLTATLISFLLGEIMEATAILVVLLINASIGFLTELKARQALTALKRQGVSFAQVLRDQKEQEIQALELVPGDLVILSAGVRVPADGRLLETVELQVEESSLTGESQAVSKISEDKVDSNAPLPERINMVYMGTTVLNGRGRFVVTSTGMNTELGRIGKLLEDTKEQQTPLERTLTKLSHTLIGIVAALCSVIVLAGWLRGNNFLEMLEVGISLAIAAVPEGLPTVTTMTLAIGMQRMSRMRALVRQLSAVETLGSTTVICTDKTGTLTKNEMTVRVIQFGDYSIDVSGSGYDFTGEFRTGGNQIEVNSDKLLSRALTIGALCNDAKIEIGEAANKVLGDPTEGALVVVAAKAGLHLSQLEQEYPRIKEVPFSSETKRMATIHRTSDGKTVAFVKGAPSVIIPACKQWLSSGQKQQMTAQDALRFMELNNKLASGALRVLAFAYQDIADENATINLDHDLVFVSLIGLIDPLREEAKAAIAKCREGGIRVVMLTGDQAKTAAEIGRQLGLSKDSEGEELLTVHGRELASMDKGVWENTVKKAAVFARISPEHKLRIVEQLQLQGEIVAMTGDGVNDAPALKKADIGIAMGIKGTEVAKESSDMIITDDNFASIVTAVEQGRIIYANIIRFVHYLFSCNFSEILTVFAAILLGWPIPITALQILWLNVITDVFPALALALEPSHTGIMKQAPRDPRQPIMSKQFIWLIVWQGFLISGSALLSFWIGLERYGTEVSLKQYPATMAFMTLALAQVFHSFNARSQTQSAFSRGIFSNKWLWLAVISCILLQVAAVYSPLLQKVLHTARLDSSDWLVVLSCSLIPIFAVEAVKLIRSWK